MEELQLALTTARVEQRNFGLWINNWQIGQSLNALVTNQLPSGELVLRVGGQQITATADIPIQQGTQLMLEVKELRPVPTLRVLTPVQNPAAPNVGGTLQLLPSSGEGLASRSLGAVAQTVQASVGQSALPPALADSLGSLLRQVSRSERLTQPQGVAGAVRDSGIFFESSLKAMEQGRPAVPAQDFKGGLFQALNRVDGALSQLQALGLGGADADMLMELKRELEAGISRVTVHQLNSQGSENTQGRSWQLEVPVQHGGAFHSLRLEIEQDRGGAPQGEHGDAARDEDEERWRVKLALSPPALGAVEVQLELAGEQLGLRLAAEREDVRALLDGAMGTLSSALASRGLALAATASVPLSEPEDVTVPPVSSLDVRA